MRQTTEPEEETGADREEKTDFWEREEKRGVFY